jgi:hypothetical protein
MQAERLAGGVRRRPPVALSESCRYPPPPRTAPSLGTPDSGRITHRLATIGATIAPAF